MILLRPLLLTFFFFVDVHVHAEEVKECWGVSWPCPVHAEEGRKVLQGKGFRLVLALDATVEQRTQNEVRLMPGQFYVESEEHTQFLTPFATFRCAESCKVLFERDSHQIKAMSLGGVLNFVRKGDSTNYKILPGTQISIREVNGEGLAEMDFPQGLPWLPTTHLWAKLFPGEPAEFKKALVEFRETWTEAVTATSQLHASFAHRQIASFEQDLEAARIARLKQEQEDRRLRDIFHDKNP